ncbi:hypothetical protein RKE29_02830 [Streptomyces sp. B1866]|uniref:hypothetical protein n=1 Tax=Streptomyces sp. B1866 TaxID=3075431 RepID=UPI00288D8B7F|nr:hypothetical protein [Streptomyces sp. B1866]MDT3395594.1 hypothetical protein [Streptomyces sp. B1866]
MSGDRDTGPVDQDDAQQPAADGAADFDAFFAEEAAARPRQRLTLYGRDYLLPDSLPLLFTLQMERVQDSSDPADVRRMLATLYGADVLDLWAEQGMTDRQLGVVLIWSAGNIRKPGSVTMRRAAELYAEQDAGKAAAPANRAARRTPARKKKGKTAPRSGARS